MGISGCVKVNPECCPCPPDCSIQSFSTAIFSRTSGDPRYLEVFFSVVELILPGEAGGGGSRNSMMNYIGATFEMYN